MTFIMTLFADFQWRIFFILATAGAFGGVAIIPYALAIQAERIGNLPMSIQQIVLLALLQGIVLMTVIVTIGMFASNSQNLALLSATKHLPLAIGAGIVAAVAIVFLERGLFMPFLPEALQQASADVPLWKRFLASFYGGFTEEILLRLFLMSVVAFILSRFWHQPVWVLWTANIIAAFVFGLLHLPTVATITTLTFIVVFRTVILNMIGGVIFGGLFINYGFVAAIVAHFSADIMLHIVLPAILQK